MFFSELEILQAGGPYWDVPLGRRDSLGASISGSNHNIPAPNDTLPTIITKFKLQHLDLIDLVALSGKILFKKL
jgi:peroxidase